jgi:peptide/nickel transport system substrate-binding protein
MRKQRVATIGAVFAVITGIVLSGTALAQSTSPSGSGGKTVFRIGTPTDMISPNLLKATNTPDYETLFNNYDLLFNFSPKDLTPAPGLATKCEPSTDFMTWTCTIRSGVKWSDGQPFTAEDIAFTYRFILDTDYYEVFTSYLPYNPTFEAPNATTLIWKSTKPTFAPTVPPWIPILPEHIWGQYECKDPSCYGSPARHFNPIPADGSGMVGTGPFTLTSWHSKQGYTFVRNPYYWGQTPTIDEIDYKVYSNQESMVNDLLAGEIDFADNLTPTLFNSLKSRPDIGTVVAEPSVFNNLAFNFGGQDTVDSTSHPTNNPVLQDKNFRLAVAKAINKQAIIDKVWQGYALPGASITVPSHKPWYYTPTDPDTQAYDPTAANALLDQSGYDKKDSDGIRLDKNGNPIILNILTLPEETGSVDTGQFIQAELQQVGIGVNLKPVSDSKADDLWYTGDFDAYVWGWGGDPDPDFILSIFTSGQCLGWSDGCWGVEPAVKDPQYDKLYQDQKTLISPDGTGRGADRIALVDKMQQHLFDQIPEIVLNYQDWLQAYRTDTFAGYVPTPTDGGTYLFGWGPYSLINLKPVSGSTGASGSSGAPVIVWILIGVALVVGVALFFMTRKRRQQEEA